MVCGHFTGSFKNQIGRAVQPGNPHSRMCMVFSQTSFTSIATPEGLRRAARRNDVIQMALPRYGSRPLVDKERKDWSTALNFSLNKVQLLFIEARYSAMKGTFLLTVQTPARSA